jgi:hypothetical protein
MLLRYEVLLIRMEITSLEVFSQPTRFVSFSTVGFGDSFPFIEEEVHQTPYSQENSLVGSCRSPSKLGER